MARGYGAASARDPTLIRRDLALGYVSAEAARDIWGMTEAEVAEVLATARRGDLPD